MMFPPALNRFVVILAIYAGLYLSEKVPLAVSDHAGLPDAVAQADQGGLKVRLNPGFDPDRPSQAEIDLIGAFLPGILLDLKSGKQENDS